MSEVPLQGVGSDLLRPERFEQPFEAGLRVKGSGLRLKIEALREPGRGAARVGSGVSIQKQLHRRNVKRFRGGLVFKAHKLLYQV